MRKIGSFLTQRILFPILRRIGKILLFWLEVALLVLIIFHLYTVTLMARNVIRANFRQNSVYYELHSKNASSTEFPEVTKLAENLHRLKIPKEVQKQYVIETEDGVNRLFSKDKSIGIAVSGNLIEVYHDNLRYILWLDGEIFHSQKYNMRINTWTNLSILEYDQEKAAQDIQKNILPFLQPLFQSQKRPLLDLQWAYEWAD